MLRSNITTMQNDVRLQYQDSLDQSHHGRPTIVETVHEGGRGRPSIHIDPDFLRWAYSLRSTSSIARYLNVGRTTVRAALLRYGITAPQENPFPLIEDLHQPEPNVQLDTTLPSPSSNSNIIAPENDDLLDPVDLAEPPVIPQSSGELLYLY